MLRLLSESNLFYKRQIINWDIGNKCFAIIATENNVDSLPKIIDAVTDHVKEHPIFVQLISEGNEKIRETERLEINSPVFFTSKLTNIITIKCSKHADKPIKLSMELLKHKNLKDVCPDTKSILRIAYNDVLPYFKLVDSRPVYDTLEGIIIADFLEKYNLVGAWYNAGQTWGSKDSNGTWNGVVGKVGYSECDVGISVISYTQERGSFVDYSHPVKDDGSKWISKPPQKHPPSTNIIHIFDKRTWLMILISMVIIRKASQFFVLR